MSENDTRPGANPEAGRVSGYRKLSDAELALVNDIKALGPEVEALLARASDLVAERTAEFGAPDGEHRRAIALARTNLQQGAMWLIRAAAAPQGLF